MNTVFIVLIFLFVKFLLMCFCADKVATSGSFKTSIVNIRDCPNPGKQFVKNPSMVYDTLIIKDEGKNMIGGNLTVFKDTRDIKMKLKSYEWLDGKWHQIHVINGIDCHGMLMYLTFAAMKVNYDKKNCMVLKGFYPLKNVDVNQLQHIWVSGLPYGRMLWRSECYSKTGMLVCKEMETVTVPDYYG